MFRPGINGYTLLEMMAVVVLLSIVSAVVVSRFSLSPFSVASFDQEMRSALRFAQKFAIVSGCEVEVDVSAAGYALRVRHDAARGCLNPSGVPLNNPVGGVFAAPPPSGVTVTALNFFYNRRGIPVDGSGAPVGDGVITVGGHAIAVEAVTGYVH